MPGASQSLTAWLSIFLGIVRIANCVFDPALINGPTTGSSGEAVLGLINDPVTFASRAAGAVLKVARGIDCGTFGSGGSCCGGGRSSGGGGGGGRW